MMGHRNDHGRGSVTGAGASGIPRREFLRRGSVAALALAGLPGDGWAAPDAPPEIRAKRVLGRTGIEISDISFGSSRSSDPRLVDHAIERGINYLDTAESYKGGASEEAIGLALQGKRDRVTLASKVKCETSSTRQELMSALEGSLRRLRTDRIDIYFNHAVNDVERLKNDEWQEFTSRAKQAGKIRFTGISGHGGRLGECIEYALDHDLVDAILCAYNFGQDPSFFDKVTRTMDFVAVQPDLPRLIAKAKSRNVGIVAMKTLRGARLNDMRPYENGGASFAQAAFRWVLSNPDVSGLVVSMTSTEEIDEFVGASGASAPRGAARDLLERYLVAQAGSYCEHGCSVCEPACPEGLPISEILRTRMYEVDYRDRAFAREEYAALAIDGSPCLACSAQPCTRSCPSGLSVSSLVKDAVVRLGS